MGCGAWGGEIWSEREGACEQFKQGNNLTNFTKLRPLNTIPKKNHNHQHNSI
jgi:hypothetical protein